MNNIIRKIEDKKEACKTYIEQTKLLVTLSSAFLVAPAAIHAFIKHTGITIFIFAEVCFISSVLMGYVVLGTLSGS